MACHRGRSAFCRGAHLEHSASAGAVDDILSVDLTCQATDERLVFADRSRRRDRDPKTHELCPLCDFYGFRCGPWWQSFECCQSTPRDRLAGFEAASDNDACALFDRHRFDPAGHRSRGEFQRDQLRRDSRRVASRWPAPAHSATTGERHRVDLGHQRQRHFPAVATRRRRACLGREPPASGIGVAPCKKRQDHLRLARLGNLRSFHLHTRRQVRQRHFDSFVIPRRALDRCHDADRSVLGYGCHRRREPHFVGHLFGHDDGERLNVDRLVSTVAGSSDEVDRLPEGPYNRAVRGGGSPLELDQRRSERGIRRGLKYEGSEIAPSGNFRRIDFDTLGQRPNS